MHIAHIAVNSEHSTVSKPCVIHKNACSERIKHSVKQDALGENRTLD